MNTSLHTVMNSSFEVISPQDSISDAMHKMESGNQTHLIVISKNNEPIGIISKTDVMYRLKLLAKNSGGKVYSDFTLRNTKVEEFMTAAPVCLDTNDNLKTALKNMLEHNFQFMPVTDENQKIVGVLTTKDVLSYVYSKIN